MLSHPAAGWRIRLFSARHTHDATACEAVFQTCVNEFTWLNQAMAPPVRWLDARRKLITWVAEVEATGDVVGFCMLEGRRAYVPYLLVDADWRLCGIGQSLLDTARDHAGVPLSLDVDADNVRAIAAYRALGFAPDHEHARSGRAQVRLVGI